MANQRKIYGNFVYFMLNFSAKIFFEKKKKRPQMIIVRGIYVDTEIC